jgi:hypothetical protein
MWRQTPQKILDKDSELNLVEILGEGVELKPDMILDSNKLKNTKIVFFDRPYCELG